MRKALICCGVAVIIAACIAAAHAGNAPFGDDISLYTNLPLPVRLFFGTVLFSGGVAIMCWGIDYSVAIVLFGWAVGFLGAAIVGLSLMPFI